MIPLLLRIASVAVLAVLAVGSITGIVILLRPSHSVQVRKFVVLTGTDSQKAEAAIISQMLAVRMQQIDSVITTDLTSDAPPEQVRIESVIPRELRLTPETGSHIDVEFKAFEFDIAGILNSILDQLHEGPTLRGVVINNDKEIEILANYREKDTDVLGPWVIRSKDGTGNAVELLAHRIVLDHHNKQTRQFGSLTADQFRVMVSSLRYYQEYVHQIKQDKVANRSPRLNRSLVLAQEGFKKLAEEKVDCSRVYSYLGSIGTILQDETGAKENFVAALELDSTDEFSKKALGTTTAAVALKPPPAEIQGTLSTLLHQQAFRTLNIEDGIKLAGTTSKILVAVVADGAQPLPEFRLVNGHDFTPGPPSSGNSHGTQVTSLIAAIAPSAEIMPIRIFDEKGGGDTATALQGIDYAIKSGARLIVLPWGTETKSQILAELLRRAAEAGALVVAPAGNNSTSTEEYPAAIPTVFSVAALDPNSKLAPFSSFGQWVKAGAPGVDILTLDPSGRLQKMSGTSASCAEAAGIAALVWSIKPELRGEQVERILVETAIATQDKRIRIGQLNALAAVSAVKAL